MLHSPKDVNLDLHERAEKAEAEVARLREALATWMRFMGQPPVDKYAHDSQWESAWKLSQAALSDTAKGREE